jgi:hypothetical protein
MIADEAIRTAEDNIDEYLPYCQASFNSDGNLTLRNYDRSNKDKDEIIIFSETETKALFALFARMKDVRQSCNLPF